MIKAVLFDLDDTLVSLNLTAFLGRYVNGAAGLLTRATGVGRVRIGAAYAKGWLGCESETRTDHMTNAQLVEKTMWDMCGIPLADPAFVDMIDTFERTVVPSYNGRTVRATPMPGAHEAVEWVQNSGLICALATNPVLSLTCDTIRMGWAGFTPDDFALVSTAQNSTRCKPWAGYYEEFCAKLGVKPEECLMVGNDARRDFPHPECGIRTIFVGHARPTRAIWSGRMSELAEALPFIVDAQNCADAR